MTTMTLADTTRFDPDAMSAALGALDRQDAATVADAFIARVLYILPGRRDHPAMQAAAAGDLDTLTTLYRAAEERGAERVWLPDDRDEQARYELARAEMFVLRALHTRIAETREDDPFGDDGSMTSKVATACAYAAGYALAGDACLLTAAPYTEMAELYFIESLGTGREAAWQCAHALDA